MMTDPELSLTRAQASRTRSRSVLNEYEASAIYVEEQLNATGYFEVTRQ